VCCHTGGDLLGTYVYLPKSWVGATPALRLTTFQMAKNSLVTKLSDSKRPPPTPPTPWLRYCFMGLGPYRFSYDGNSLEEGCRHNVDPGGLCLGFKLCQLCRGYHCTQPVLLGCFKCGDWGKETDWQGFVYWYIITITWQLLGRSNYKKITAAQLSCTSCKHTISLSGNHRTKGDGLRMS